jgi:hypothetical protein
MLRHAKPLQYNSELKLKHIMTAANRLRDDGPNCFKFRQKGA